MATTSYLDGALGLTTRDALTCKVGVVSDMPAYARPVCAAFLHAVRKQFRRTGLSARIDAPDNMNWISPPAGVRDHADGVMFASETHVVTVAVRFLREAPHRPAYDLTVWPLNTAKQSSGRGAVVTSDDPDDAALEAARAFTRCALA